MKIFTFLTIAFLSLSASLAGAQTNIPAKTPSEQVVEIDSVGGYFDGLTNQIVYMGHVVVTDRVKDTMKAKLTCEWLTVDLPPNGGHPTNIVAQTNVVVDALDASGKTYHITAATAIYAYHLLNPATNLVHSATNPLLVFTNVVYATTNETITFTGGNPTPKVETSDAIITGDPLVLNVPTKHFSGMSKTIYKAPAGSGGTNASPFDFMKK